MNIQLPARIEDYVKSKVQSGDYNSRGEVVVEALRLLEDHDRWLEARRQSLRRELMIGVEQLDRGEGVVFDESQVRRIKAEGRRKLASERKRTRSA